MVVLHAYVHLRSDQVSAGIAACTEVRHLSVLEPGCDRYDFFQSPDDATRLVFVEEWESKAALDLHFQQPAFLEFVAKMESLVERPSEIRIFESNLL
ncbi:MAG: putative quinol monooxygenase [Fimbriimonadaceae bacterium]